MRWQAGILLLLVAVRWWPAMDESLWLDETLTAFVLSHGTDHPSLAIAPGVQTSPYFPLLSAWSAVFGDSEIALRLPSLLLSLAALAFLWRIVRRFIGADAAWIAVFLCFVTRDFALRATEARPYGLVLALAAAAMWWMIRYVDDRAVWPYAAAFCICGALLVWTQVVLAPFLLVCLGYALNKGARPLVVMGMAVAIGAVSLPALIAAVDGAGEAQHVFATPPSLGDTSTGLQLPLIAIVAVLAWLAGRFMGGGETRPGGLLALTWWLWQPLLLLAISYAADTGLFVRRYFVTAVLGAAWMGAWLVARLIPQRHLRAASLTIGGAMLLFAAVRPAPSHDSPRREAAVLASEWAQANNALVLVASEFVEAQPPVWTPEYRLPGFLYANLDRYPIPGELLLLPNRAAPKQPEELVTRHLSTRPVIVYGGAASAGFWVEWLAHQPQLAGWKITHRQLGDTVVCMFAP